MVKIQDAAQATTANLTDRVPVSQGDGLAKTITAQQIVDLAEANIAVMAGGMKSFFFTKTASDVAGMYKAINTMPTGGVQTIATVIGDDETILASFIEDVHTAPYRVIDGSRFFHQQAFVSSTARPVQLRGYVYLCDVNGLNPALLRTSTLSASLTTVNSEVMMSVWGGSLEIPITQRAKFIITAVKTGAGTSPTVTLSIDDDTFSRLDVPTAVEPVAAASETVAGIVKLATAAEVTTGTDPEKAVTPAGAKVELDKKLPKTADVIEVTGTTATVLTSWNGKRVRFTSATAVTLTIPATTGFTTGFQCSLFNDSANAVDVSFSGTIKAGGFTKISKEKGATLRMDDVFRATGGLS